MALILELVEATASRAGRDRVMSTKQGLELALLISGDDVVPGVQAPALPAALIEVENPAGLLREVGIAREYPGAPRPRPDRVLRQIAPDRGARDRADDPALDSLSRDLSVRPARQRSTRLGRKLAGQRFDLRDLCGGKTTGAGQASASHPTQAVLLRTIVAATYAHIAQSHPVGERSQHWSLPQQRAARPSREPLHDADGCTGQLDGATPAPRSRSARSHTCWPLPTRFPNVYGKSFNQPGTYFRRDH
jgi:hypothetical protein